ncbi:hypothetical protein GCM10009816_25690 [Microbacterium aquimaris]
MHPKDTLERQGHEALWLAHAAPYADDTSWHVKVRKLTTRHVADLAMLALDGWQPRIAPRSARFISITLTWVGASGSQESSSPGASTVSDIYPPPRTGRPIACARARARGGRSWLTHSRPRGR